MLYSNLKKSSYKSKFTGREYLQVNIAYSQFLKQLLKVHTAEDALVQEILNTINSYLDGEPAGDEMLIEPKKFIKI